MKRVVALALWGFALAGLEARAEHAKINLDVAGPKEQRTAYMDQTPPASGKNPRPVVHAKVNEPIKVQWMFTNVYPHKTLENVVVHFYVARQEKVGQKEIPELGEDVVQESAFEMDFKPGAKAGQRNTFKIDAPGAYLVRVESRQTGSDHEHFAAIDLVIEAAKP
ncbi:MAG: hypothetical protein P4L84_31920 [Isosphaeraceae bacterium]|nr:hypothetical protein [Isosphaeraceae bacterium]